MADPMSAIHLLFGLVISAPLLYGAAAKLLDPARFREAAPRYGLGRLGSQLTGSQIPATIELVGAASLILAPVALTAAIVASLYLLFTALLLRAAALGSSGDCGCFGALGGRIDHAAALRNASWCAGASVLGYLRLNSELPPYDIRLAAALVAVTFLMAAAVEAGLELRHERV